MVKVQRAGLSADLPSPAETWKKSKPYIPEPFAKRGEFDQGILSFTWLSLKLVAQGYVIALLVGTPIGFLPRSVEDLREDVRPDLPGAAPGVALWRGCRLAWCSSSARS